MDLRRTSLGAHVGHERIDGTVEQAAAETDEENRAAQELDRRREGGCLETDDDRGEREEEQPEDGVGGEAEEVAQGCSNHGVG